jgi:hypothetical protein
MVRAGCQARRMVVWLTKGVGCGVLQHEGDDRKLRGMATGSEGLGGWRSPEGGGEDGGGSDNPRGGGDALVGQGDRGRGGEVGRCVRPCQGGSNTGLKKGRRSAA